MLLRWNTYLMQKFISSSGDKCVTCGWTFYSYRYSSFGIEFLNIWNSNELRVDLFFRFISRKKLPRVQNFRNTFLKTHIDKFNIRIAVENSEQFMNLLRNQCVPRLWTLFVSLFGYCSNNERICIIGTLPVDVFLKFSSQKKIILNWIIKFQRSITSQRLSCLSIEFSTYYLNWSYNLKFHCREEMNRILTSQL